MSRSDLRMDPRAGGRVRRWHTWSILNDQPMSDHQWNVTRIVLAIYPEASRDVIIEALFHDIGEVGSGDHPSLSKTDPAFRRELHRLEDQTRLDMVIPWALPSKRRLADMELWVIKLADIIDRWEFALHEIAMGNSLCQEVVDDAEVDLGKMTTQGYWLGWNEEVAENVRWYMNARRSAHNGR